MLPENRKPTHPGRILLQEFLEPAGITQTELSDELDISVQRVNEIVNEKRRVTADTAVRLADYFDTTAQFWLNLQQDVDLWEAKQKMEPA